MVTRKIEKEEWDTFFSGFSIDFTGASSAVPAEFLVLTRTFGQQEIVKRKLLKAVSYDSSRETLNVLLGDQEHKALYPSEVYLYETRKSHRIIIDILQTDGEEDLIEVFVRS